MSVPKDEDKQLNNNKFLKSEGSYYLDPAYPDLPEVMLRFYINEDAKAIAKARRSMQEIIPGLFLGPYASASIKNLEAMKTVGLTHVVCVRQKLEENLIIPNHMNHFKYIVVEVAEKASDNIIQLFKVVNSFIDECLETNGKVLIHGNTGSYRSPAFAIAYLMWRHGTSWFNATSYVELKRIGVCLDKQIKLQLEEFEPILKALHTVPNSSNIQGSNRGEKRAAEGEDEPMDLSGDQDVEMAN